MRRLITFFLFIFPILAYCQAMPTYKNWDKHDVIKIYQKQELPADTIDEEGEDITAVYTSSKLRDGIYEIELYKISSKFYQIRGSNTYILFRYTPYLYSYDDGILEISYNSGTFYKKP
ncbi:hypothetical protein [Chryseobacterium sp. 5_R23647]|uniref:hypothetical protein n=1 Tax=Chryseobacterium sp. 5_R23647 TaxID=2258964 RepID=UPI000E2359A2|nr:hypothetical protein [Chryseobacterium sp. 5_R23647]REC41692.1 hypothetical protein DRF69_14235 [Chryseobacterium sp. 5_R23647]